MRQLFRNIALIGIGLVAGIAATIQLSATAQQGTNTLPLDELRTLSNVFGQIKREYVEPIEDKQLLTDAVKGMVSSLDPHSAYLDKKDFSEMQEQTAGKFAVSVLRLPRKTVWSRCLIRLKDRPLQRQASKQVI